MLLNAFKREVVLFWILLSIVGSLALARVDNNWSRRPNVTVAQHHGGQVDYRPAAGVGYQKTQWNRPNQTYGQTNNNRTQYPQTNNYRPVMPIPASNTRPQMPAYGHGGVYNQSRPASNINYGHGGTNNQSRPFWQQPAAPSYPPHPVYNHTRPNYPPQYPQPSPAQQPSNYPPNSVNFTRPVPSAPLLPIPSSNPAGPPGSSNLYPKLPTINLPSQPAPAAPGNNGIPLASLHPAPQTPQGPHNWHSGGQAVLSYGPGHYPSPAGQTNKNPPSHQGSSNPYANMFI